MTIWSSDKLQLLDFAQIKHRFFVRMEGWEEENIDKIRDVFEDVEIVEANVENETAFITNEIPENDFEEKIKKFPNILSRIRVMF